MSLSTATTTDAELVELAREGDRLAFGELLMRHDDRMRGLAYRLLADRHAMDDALQDAYLKVYRGIPGFRAGSDFGRWIYRITYNSCVDELRRRRRHPVAAHEDADRASTAAGPAQAVSTAEVVRRALSALPAAQRVAVVLVDGEGFDRDAVADILGVAPGTVASRLHRARTTLRRALWEDVG